MRIAVSNIAWEAAEDEEVGVLMKSLGIEGLEIAPTRIWAQPLSSTSFERQALKESWSERGIAIVSLQALLFGRPDLRIFDSPSNRTETLDYLAGMIELAADIGATRLVFGSPRNRARGSMDSRKAEEIAVPFFREIGKLAVDAGAVFCIEPNPVEYACDWITTIEEGRQLVLAIDHEGIALNADAGGITLAGDDADDAIAASAARIAHFHISEPHLASIGGGTVDHSRFAMALRTIGYTGWASVEMRLPEAPDRIAVLAHSFGVAADAYG